MGYDTWQLAWFTSLKKQAKTEFLQIEIFFSFYRLLSKN